MKRAFKKYFIPHAENNYHPHILHAKRAVAYSLFFVGIKAFIVGAVLLVPLPVFVAPDVLAVEQNRLVHLINDLRATKDRPALQTQNTLNRSAELKADDMATQQYFSHTGPDNHGLTYFLKQAGYTYHIAGENLAMGFFNADEVLAAWIKSPTHYKNLVDSDYMQLGTSMVSGLYTDIPTAYAVAHFGSPVTPVEPVATVPDKKVALAAAIPLATTTPAVLGTSQKAPAPAAAPAPALPTPVAFAPSTLEYDPSHSAVTWKAVDGGVEVHITAAITGLVKEARVEFPDTSVLLAPTDMPGIFSGTSVLATLPQELFRVIVPPTIIVEGADGEQLSDAIAWVNPAIISPTPLERYITAERSVPVVAGLFTFSRGLYVGFLILFTVSLASLVAIEIRKQRPHIIVQTLGLIGLLVVLILV